MLGWLNLELDSEMDFPDRMSWSFFLIFGKITIDGLAWEEQRQPTTHNFALDHFQNGEKIYTEMRKYYVNGTKNSSGTPLSKKKKPSWVTRKISAATPNRNAGVRWKTTVVENQAN